MKTEKTLHEKLVEIQQTLKAPKGQYNAFSKFNYRSCEDILEAVKPLLDGCSLVISDEVVNVGNSNYVKAVVSLHQGQDEHISVTAFAKEAENQTGMQAAQITGSTSSYARKYALNGLFAIDDTKDADTQDNTAKPIVEPKKATVDSDPDWISEESGTKRETAPVEAKTCSEHKKPLLRGVSKTKFTKDGQPKVYWYHVQDGGEFCFEFKKVPNN